MMLDTHAFGLPQLVTGSLLVKRRALFLVFSLLSLPLAGRVVWLVRCILSASIAFCFCRPGHLDSLALGS